MFVIYFTHKFSPGQPCQGTSYVCCVKLGLTKNNALQNNEFVQSCFQDCFLGVLYIKKNRTIPIFVCVSEKF
jgi:hypothetical protein